MDRGSKLPANKRSVCRVSVPWRAQHAVRYPARVRAGIDGGVGKRRRSRGLPQKCFSSPQAHAGACALRASVKDPITDQLPPGSAYCLRASSDRAGCKRPGTCKGDPSTFLPFTTRRADVPISPECAISIASNTWRELARPSAQIHGWLWPAPLR